MINNILKEPIVESEMILKLIPQKPPFVMVNSLLEYSHLTGRTEFTITSDNLLLQDGHFSEPGIIEHMAQSMSLHRGYRGYLNGLDRPQTGFIGAIKSVEIYTLPLVGTKLTTYVEILQEVLKVTCVSAKTTTHDGNLIATSEMRTVTVD